MGHSRALIWSPEAERDLLDIWSYLSAVASDASADRHLRRLDQACRTLLGTPLRGRPRDELRPGLRSLLIPPHVLFYRVRPLAVEVVRVMHERRDLQAIFDGT